MVKKYKLIKKYPGSPKLGTVVVDTNINNVAKDAYFSENWGKANSGSAFIIGKNHDCENQPEFWEEIKEKDYEIIKLIATHSPGNNPISDMYCDGKIAWSTDDSPEYEYPEDILKEGFHKIYSIKRLSDGEVFTLGDRIHETITGGDKDRYTIKQFSLKDVRCFANGVNIIFIEKVKQPLFVTGDGKEIFDGDSCVEIIPNTFISHYYENWRKYFGDNGKPLPGKLMFSTKEAAEKWIDENKPVYSKRDIEEALLNPLNGFWERAYGRLFEEKLNYGKA